MKKLAILLSLIAVSVLNVYPKEGMWLPVLIGNNIEEMKAMGLNLDAEDLYNENGASLKDAIVRFGGGCTASFISPDGLLITNHHCGYGRIQSHSSVENDYLLHGFWASSPEEELPNPGLTVTILVRMEDVTQRVNSVLNDQMNEKERQQAVRDEIKNITQEASEDGKYEAQVRPFYYGNEYYLFVSEIFHDVRLVGAPPSAIGKFGGDVDNWMWPRHSGDFALFRVYADADNNPAEYSTENVPYNPEHFLPVSNKGQQENDFTMVYGFPGRTNQYLTSHEVEFKIEKQNPAAIDIRTSILNMYESEMEKSDKVRIQYASKHAGVSNAWKKWKGESRGLKDLNAVAKKKELEQEFSIWASTSHSDEYKGLMQAFDNIYNDYLPYRMATNLYYEAGRGAEIIRFAQSFRSLVDLSKEKNPDVDKINEEVEKLKASAKRHFKDYHAPIDRKVLEAVTRHYIDLSDPDLMPEGLRHVDARFGEDEDIEGFADNIFSRSFLISDDKVMKFLDDYSPKDYKKLEKDVAFRYAIQLLEFYHNEIAPEQNVLSSSLDSLYRIYTAGLRKMQTHRNFFPDANGTLRITYGKVEGSEPRDGLVYKYYTTAEGILEKASNTEIKDYQIPQRLKDLLEEKQYGDFDNNGKLQVNFLGSNHTTGGNSGSPVIGANGEFIGLNFDRSWESTMSDIMFDPDQCRNIAINSRYILWVISQYAQMDYLLDEMKIVEDPLNVEAEGENPVENGTITD